MSVNRMTTGQVLGGLSRREHVFATNRTIVLIFVLEALMSIKDTNRDAHAALVAMTKCLDTSDTAKSTAIAMEGFLALQNSQQMESVLRETTQ